MASTYGRKFKVKIDGTSHGDSIKVRIEGVPEGTVIDYGELDDFLRRRSPLNEELEGLVTERKEPDEVIWREGVVNFAGRLGIVSKPIIEAEVKNTDVDSSSYKKLRYIPRPGHADFTMMMKDGIEADTTGGARFSGRLTVGLCIAGGIAKQLLKKEGIEIMTDIVEIGGQTDPMGFEDMVEAARAREDSVGGIVECGIMGVKAGSCGDAYFDGLEGRISEAVFGIPAIKGIEFGSGFKGSRLLGSVNNDPFIREENGEIRTLTNNHGGILGGIASGMPIVFRAAIKPTASIPKKQKSVNLKTGEEVEISIAGRHDPCIVYRALPCIEAAAAIAIYDALSENDEITEEAKRGSEEAKAAPAEEKKVFGLLGKKLLHSYSPLLHQLISEETGNDYSYGIFEKSEEELEDFIRKGEWSGLNVTIPYKEKVIKYLDEISPEANAIGAVNTIVRREGKLVGYNTDYYGLKNMLENSGVDINGKKCVILGSGGASKAASQVLFDKGASEVHVLSHRAIEDKSGFGNISDCELMLNATPVGMYPNEGISPVNPGSFTKLRWVVDLIYNPLRTEFVCQAKKNLIDSVGGFDMLIWQGIYSATLFCSKKFEDRKALFESIKHKMMESVSNIVLIGMPGSGKSTIGRAISEKTGMEFYDTDVMIEAREGRTIPEIFREEGEEYFRDVESTVIGEMRNLKGAVISTGGGTVEREENYYSLAGNGRIYFLDRAPSALATVGRPLSSEKGVEWLYERRLPLYRAWADEVIDGNLEKIDSIVEQII